MGLYIVGSYANPHITPPYMGSHPVQLPADTRQPTIEHKGIQHGRFDVPMAQQFLNSSKLIPAFEQMGGERIRMTRDS